MDIKEKVKLQSFNRLSEPICFGEIVEEINEIHSKNASRKTTWEASTGRKPTLVARTRRLSIKYQTATNKGKEVGKDNQEANGKKTDQNPYVRPFKSVCYRCGQTGHPSSACPQCKTMAFVDEENEDSFENNKESEEEAEMIGADDRDQVSCVLQRVLITPKGRITSSTALSFQDNMHNQQQSLQCHHR